MSLIQELVKWYMLLPSEEQKRVIKSMNQERDRLYSEMRRNVEETLREQHAGKSNIQQNSTIS